jgi:hypothetical protein
MTPRNRDDLPKMIADKFATTLSDHP